MDSLNEQQRAAAEFRGRHLLVLAGAGTGKTRTVIARAKHLIDSGVDPRRILLLSFTRRSANEIVERISAQLPETKSEGLTGATFHSWCMSIIKNHPQVFPQASFTLLDEDDQESCFQLLCGRNWSHRGIDDKKVKPKDILQVYSYMANARCSLSDAIRMKMYDNAPKSTDVSVDLEILKGVISMYIDYKRKRRYMDYDDILLTVSQYLRRNPELRAHIAGLYDHILIDEMQDTNPLQYELLRSFMDRCHLFCVGDDAQSIYGFRGADFKAVHDFPAVAEGAEVRKLTINYRSTQEILDLSNWLIRQSPLNYRKELTAVRGHGPKPVFRHWADEWEEANNVALSIKRSFAEDGVAWKENLVLSRTAYANKKTEAAFIKHKVPYILIGGRGLMASRHIRDIVSPLRIVGNYLDEIAWSRYLQLWHNLGAVKAAAIVGKVMNARNLDDSLSTLTEATLEMGLQTEISETLVKVAGLAGNPSKAISEALSVMERRMREIYKEEWKWRKEDFPLLVDIARKSATVGEFVAEYVLDPQLEITQKEGAKSDDVVKLTTIHSAKGLEASHVYLLNASANGYPTQRAILNGEEAVEEERRCLYVALTRAKDRLVVYRDIHSVHANAVGAPGFAAPARQRYFFNRLPASLHESENIAANYFPGAGAPGAAPAKEEDIYSDFDLS